jgi:chromosomal replication initiator protein
MNEGSRENMEKTTMRDFTMFENTIQCHDDDIEKALLRARNLNKKDYTFDNYVVGEYNSFAFKTAISIAKNSESAYNPVFLYGDTGLGKTHLLKAIGNYICENIRNKVIYITANDFLHEFILSISDCKVPIFANKYRNADVLLLDDIQYLQNKHATQEELFFTLDALYYKNKQVVLTCDRPVSELKDFSDRLKNRISRGLIIEIKSPDYETRYKILQNMAEYKKVTIPEDVIALIANNITKNIFDLESSIISLAAYSESINKLVTMEMAQDLLKNIFNKSGGIGTYGP